MVTLAHLINLMLFCRIYPPSLLEMKPRVQKIENPQNSVQVCTEQPSIPCLAYKGLDLIGNNPEAVIILSSGLAVTVFCWGLGKGIAEVVAKLKQ